MSTISYSRNYQLVSTSYTFHRIKLKLINTISWKLIKDIPAPLTYSPTTQKKLTKRGQKKIIANIKDLYKRTKEKPNKRDLLFSSALAKDLLGLLILCRVWLAWWELPQACIYLFLRLLICCSMKHFWINSICGQRLLQHPSWLKP